jgi:hypothetical protein
VAAKIASGALTVDALKNGPSATRALVPGAILPAPVHPPPTAAHKAAPVAPAESPCEAEELLDKLVAVLFGLRGDAWAAVAAAVPAELQERIDRYFGLY